MTIEEAATTLGLAPHEVAPELVERNYRLKAMHCHPDRASYPGAAAEFKRATAAFNRLQQPSDVLEKTSSPNPNADVSHAAENFVFVSGYVIPELWLQLSWSDWLGKLAGTHELRHRKAGTVRKGSALAEVHTGKISKPARPLVVAPIDVEVLEFETKRCFHFWTLRPLETDQVLRRLQNYQAAGCQLALAVERLANELFDAARIPLSV